MPNLVEELEKGKKTLAQLIGSLPLKTQQEEISANNFQVFVYAAAHDPKLLRDLITVAQNIDTKMETGIILEILRNDKYKILETAVEFGHVDAVKHLHEAAKNLLTQPKIKANNPDLIPNMFNRSKDAKLFKLAAAKGHTEVFKFIRDLKMAPKDMSTWVDALCDAAKNGNKELFESIKDTINLNFEGKLLHDPKSREAKEKSALEYKLFDAIIAALEKKEGDSPETDKKKEAIAVQLFDFIYRHESEEHPLLKSLFSMGETAEVKAERHRPKPKTSYTSPRKAPTKTEAEIKQQYEIFITALEHDRHKFFTTTLTLILNEVDPDLAESAVEYTFEDVDPELVEDSILMTLAQGNQDSLDLMDLILGAKTASADNPSIGETRTSPGKDSENKRRSSGDAAASVAKTAETAQPKKPTKVFRRSDRASASAPNLLSGKGKAAEASDDTSMEMSQLTTRRGIPRGTSLFSLSGMTRTVVREDAAEAGASDQTPPSTTKRRATTVLASKKSLSQTGKDTQGAGSAGQQ